MALHSISDVVTIWPFAHTNFSVLFEKSHHNRQPLLVFFSGLTLVHLGLPFPTRDRSSQLPSQNTYWGCTYIKLIEIF